MRSVERDFLLFLLAVSAGSADGWSYFGLGHAFVANMTGNTVLLGLSVFQNHGDWLHPFISLSCYLVGAAVASFFTKQVRAEDLWPKSVSRVLLLEALILTGAEAVWVVIHRGVSSPGPASPFVLNSLLGCVAFAVGLQSGSMVQLKIPGVVTTYITGTWTTLTSGLVRFATQRQKSSPQKPGFDGRLLIQAGIVSSYFLAAVLAGWLFRHAPLAVGAIPASALLFVALYGAIRTWHTA